MILDAILIMLIGLVQAAFSLLPPWDVSGFLFEGMRVGDDVFDPMNSGVSGTVNKTPLWHFMDLAAQWNSFLPVDHFVTIIGLFATAWTCVIGYKVVRFIIGTIRGSGTS